MESLTLPALKTDADLKLKVENRKKNVFVTQLEEHREQKDEHIKHIPVITEGSSGLLETGVNTLQSTLVLKKHVEVDEMNTQLMDKRQQVHDCMKLLRERRAQLQQRQTETKQRAAEFEKFVEENELKRRRALKKFQTERQQIELKEKEKAELCSLLQDLQARRLYLKERVNKFKIFEDFLMKTLDLLPDNYLGYRTELVTAIIRRYETLSVSRQDLLLQLNSLTDEMKTSQEQLDALKHQHNTYKLTTNQELSELQTQLDQTSEKNKQLEMTLRMHMSQSRDQVEEVGNILIAVRNLGEQCYLSHYGPLDGMDAATMMDMIKEFMVEKADLERRAMRVTDSSAATAKKSNSGRTQMKSRSSGATGMKSRSSGATGMKSRSSGATGMKSRSSGATGMKMLQ
ncbi:coiled-coil domain-containing protein 42 homolog isoform X2 [Pimephales promelas]|uniref:coiled-coil domain-containing protein 42 homolog isoform X2 n=1 Tax=Pimephales promelas TaxID=90988 RepID=UPI0019554F63|nr:coiled-coil domain-containing protein 42 homolog isoform X2 [Pimephales promelas]